MRNGQTKDQIFYKAFEQWERKKFVLKTRLSLKYKAITATASKHSPGLEELEVPGVHPLFFEKST